MFTHLLSTFYRFSVSLLRDWLSNFAYKSKRIFVVVIIMLLSFSSLPQIFAKQIAKQTTIATQRIKKQRIINLNSFTWQSLSWVVWSWFAASSSWYYWSGRCVWDISHMYWTGLSSYTGLLDRSGWTGSRTWFDQQTMILSSGTWVLIHQSLLMSGNYLMMNWCSWSGGSIIYPGEREYLSRLILFSGELLELPPVFTGVKPLLSIVNVWSSGQWFWWKGVASGQKMWWSSTFSLWNQGDNKKKWRRIVQSSKEFESLIGQWVWVLRYQKTKKPRDVGQPNTLQISDDVIYLSSWWVLQAELVSGTIVSTSQWQQLNVSNFVLQELSDPVTILNAKKTTDWKQDVIELGTPWDHLIFSKPVMVQYSSDLPDGSVVAIEVKHADSVAWSTQWLSTQGDATCDLAGNISIPNSFAVVQSGQITFYTCGASLFTMNSVWWNAWSNDLRILIWDYGQMQVYYNGLAQIFGWNPPAAGAGGPSSRPILRVWAINVGNGANAWNTASTTWSWFDNTYNAVTNLSYVTWGLTYSVKIDWQYIAPNKTFTQSYTWTIPTGNTQPVKWYYGMDSFVAWADANDVWYYTWWSNPTAGIYDNVANIFLAQKYLSGRMWSWYVSSWYATVNTLTLWWANYPNSTTTTAWDLWFGVNWDFGTTPWTYTSVIERPVKPYVSSGVVDIVPWVWQPQWQLVVWTISNVPVTLTNAGLISSTGLHQIRFTVPTLLSWSSTGFTSNGWSCGAQTWTIILCSKTTSISSITGDFLTIPVTPTLAASGTTPTFTVFFSGWADSNVTNNTGTVIAAIPVGFNGLLTNASLWLKANAGTNCTTDWCSISKWNDVWWSNNHAIQNTGSAQPIYKSNIINWNPVINFNTTGKYLINTTWWTYRTVFAVRNLWWVWYQYLFSAPSLSDFSIRAAWWFNGTTNVTYTDWPNSWDWSSGWLLAINGRTTNTWRVNYHLVRSVSALPRSNTGYSISNTLLGRWMYGNDGVAELLIYSTWLTALDTSKIESYLATK